MPILSLRVFTFDWLKIALGVGAISGLVALVCLGCVVWANGNSRNLALAGGALVGAIVLMAIQLAFELRAATEQDFFSVEYTIDRAVPYIRQWIYGIHGSGWRLGVEEGAGRALGQSHPELFITGDRDKLTRDMVVFSTLAFFFWEQRDWQLKRTIFKGKTTGTNIQTMLGSRPDECTMISGDMVIDMLRRAGNSFASASEPLQRRSVCFPPKSTLKILPDSLVLTNPYCEISFSFEPSGGVHFTKPRTGGDVPQLPSDGGAQLESRLTGIRVTITYSALRAQDVKMTKYQDWTKQMLEGLRDWFEAADQ
jgi:hypothetical protein